MHSFSFFEADANYKYDILRAFNRKKFKGHKIIAEEAEPYNGKKSKEKDYKKKKRKKPGNQHQGDKRKKRGKSKSLYV